jgi:excisionase family DNA binding protein
LIWRTDVRLRAPAGKLLTVRDVALKLRLSTATVYGLCASGQLPHVRVINSIRVTPADLDAFLVRRRSAGAGDKR